MASSSASCPVIALFRSPVFNASEGFVQAQAAGLMRYRPLVVGLEAKGNVLPALGDRILLAEHGLAFRLGRVGGMADRLRAHRPVLIHAHFATDGLLALPLAEALGVPLVTTLHGYDISRSRGHMLGSGRLSWMRYALFQRRLQDRGRLFLAVSDALRSQALARGYPEDRTLTHYLGVDLARFGGAGTPEPGLIIHVGRLVEKKGTSILLDAFARLGRGRLVVIGDGPLSGALERQAQGLGDRVRFLGEVTPAEVADWMRRAWLLAAPSVTARDGDSEGLPTVIAEAAASALPAIGTDHSGIPEVIIDGETGFLVPERDAGALAARMSDLLDARDLRHRMGAAARRLAREKFDAARQIARLESLYDGLIGATPDRDGAGSR